MTQLFGASVVANGNGVRPFEPHSSFLLLVELPKGHCQEETVVSAESNWVERIGMLECFNHGVPLGTTVQRDVQCVPVLRRIRIQFDGFSCMLDGTRWIPKGLFGARRQ